jgi:hypothetical protein
MSLYEDSGHGVDDPLFFNVHLLQSGTWIIKSTPRVFRVVWQNCRAFVVMKSGNLKAL